MATPQLYGHLNPAVFPILRPLIIMQDQVPVPVSVRESDKPLICNPKPWVLTVRDDFALTVRAGDIMLAYTSILLY